MMNAQDCKTVTKSLCGSELCHNWPPECFDPSAGLSTYFGIVLISKSIFHLDIKQDASWCVSYHAITVIVSFWQCSEYPVVFWYCSRVSQTYTPLPITPNPSREGITGSCDIVMVDIGTYIFHWQNPNETRHCENAATVAGAPKRWMCQLHHLDGSRHPGPIDIFLQNLTEPTSWTGAVRRPVAGNG
jgi:hypothetical protein